MTALLKKSWPRPTSTSSVSRTRGSLPCAASARTSAGRTNSLSSRSSAFSSAGHHARRRMVLVIHVRDRAQPIVRVADNLAHELGGARVVEAGQQHERAKSDELILVALDRSNQRRRDSRRLARAGAPGTRSCGRESRGYRANRSPLEWLRRTSAADHAPAPQCRAAPRPDPTHRQPGQRNRDGEYENATS